MAREALRDWQTRGRSGMAGAGLSAAKTTFVRGHTSHCWASLTPSSEAPLDPTNPAKARHAADGSLKTSMPQVSSRENVVFTHAPTSSIPDN